MTQRRASYLPLLLLLVACDRTRPTHDATHEARALYAVRCVPCHGAHGAGDGVASGGLRPRPRDFRDPAWQASISDAQIERIIRQGGAAVGKSAAMPANTDLDARPEVVRALRALLRSMR